jgi:serine/threonine protein kinase
MKICSVCQFCYEDTFSLCPADDAPLESAMPGSTVLDNKFRLESRLGKGGMGLVYRAMHLGLKRYVAVKTLLPKNLSQQEFIERFRREAEALGRLKHPNIVSVMDFGFTKIGKEDVGYLVMEFLQGFSLNSLMKERKTFSLKDTVKIMSQVADAVSAAHELGILHRDLKPDNIFIEDKTTLKLKVLDFGLAKVTDPTSNKQDLEPEETMSKYIEPILKKLAKRDALNSKDKIADSVGSFEITQERKNLRTAEVFANTESMNLGTQDFLEAKTDIFNSTVEYVTHTGAMVGTLPYMSPEQCCAKPATSASDVYSLGIIAYEMLTGRRPFLGKSFELALQHINQEAEPPSKLVPSLSKSVDEAILNALAKSLAERTSSAKNFVLELSKDLENEKRQKENLRRIAIGSMIAASLVLVITTFVNPSNRALIASYLSGTNSVEEKDLIANYYSSLKLVSLVNKKELVLSKTTNISLRKEQIFEYQTSRHFLTKFSIDGKLLAVLQPSKGELSVWNVETNKLLYKANVEKFADRVTNLCFSSDNQQLMFAAVNKLFILNANDGSLIKTIDNFERNIFLYPLKKEQFLVASLRHPVLEQLISGNRYPLDETNSLISIWNNENKVSEILQKYGQIKKISLVESKEGFLMLVDWLISEKEPTKKIELWFLAENNPKLIESWPTNENGMATISNNGEKVALYLSEKEVIEIDLATKKEIGKHKIASAPLIALFYDKGGNLITVTPNSIKDISSNEVNYPLAKNSQLLEANGDNKFITLQSLVREIP